MRFSERIGKKKVKCEIQVESMDSDLRNGLWNILYEQMLGQLQFRGSLEVDESWEGVIDSLYHNFFKQPIDEIPMSFAHKVQENVKKWFFKAKWNEIYDLIEFIVQIKSPIVPEIFIHKCNHVLERELSAYRFVGNEIVAITDDVEKDEIELALHTANKYKLAGVKSHLETALTKLSDRKNPDYRNSIKESISAVESLCIVISKDPSASLGQALKLIKSNIELHPALEKGFSSIYGYTSNADGIRHAMIEESECDFDDAKYMLVSCSAFVNYLTMKANRAGLI